ncbi:molecular chaperone DnaK [Candidatus Roizmanbacteria bacterium RIFOXYB2_FULL_41_10]|uniref:Chaperone protein DnaK n=1 Tax=Candidatus Roizmanbacteria bacterium RIFOXYA1_FULL_41_12 TaxID=1802082 RepID=A0A1F7KGF7_9BACT|nr:MAG: molecular chaperone DnaK [Candidatus Roizmanbacteria bacterium RIFOXYA2_FULL_41_8]OGK66943.1 MAG: molecular chaperone DnaK [Candidatus Roizmanbacteria bacterium RIFOXYA1_FULL_41_12]OGK67211.1 MAG: molecular chaperone DnaK [Candidatus Roizmanbacteria bacterium RIFOXYB1_FULL_41_27]OGK72272.1 MAG: molecular chaperone DnaK [Candidatus Roizmanbacteria bacterium RIFOXYB2_FULL_41_10]OGK72304.1 MAG: molecular chaperone DnaK [Candidatus Roizmanbacteria bacterium RIFOXYC1_FULL_41_16]OGK75278.1 M
MAKTIGIDLGTTNSCVAVMEGGKAKVIPSSEGRNVTPSVVDPIKRIVGDVAKRQLIIKPKQTVYSVKRIVGKKFNDKTVKKDLEWLSYKIKGGRDDMAVVSIDDKEFTPQEISAMILSKLKKDAESYLGETVDKAVITVPAYFNDAQRQATKQAGEIAGLEVIRIINEPTAASLAYGLDKKQAHNIAVYDLGGGTFDITILELGEGVFQVKATNGDTHLGGDDFDQLLVNYLADEFKKENGVDLTKDAQALQRLRDAAEKAKIELSSTTEAEINLPFVTVKDNQPLHFVTKLTRAKMETIVSELIEKTFKPVEAVLKDAKLKTTDIQEVILVGGMTRMPKVIAEVKKFFGKEPNRTVNPDEVVAVGAAIQAGVISGDVKDVVLLDVTPLTLGVETLGGVMTPLINRNTTVPTSKAEVFSTAADNQTSVEIHILQGERPMATDNKSLGRFILEGIPPSPRGIPQVEVKFDLDANGILTVTAKDKASGKEQSIRITGSTGLTDDEIEKMKKAAEEHKETDQKLKELIEVRNQADALIYTAEKSLKDAGDKAPKDLVESVKKQIEELKKVKEKDNKDEINSALTKLNEELSKVGQHLYQKPEDQKAPDESSTKEEENKNDKKNGKVEEGEVVN